MKNRKHILKRVFGCVLAVLAILIIGSLSGNQRFTASAISYPAYFEVIKDRAAVREGPGSQYKIKGRVSIGKRLKVYGSAKSKEGNTFYKIKNSKGDFRYIYYGRVAYRGSIKTDYNKKMVVVNSGEELMFWNNPYTDKLSKYTSRVYPGYGYGSTFTASYKINRNNVIWYKVKGKNIFVHSKHVKEHTSCTWNSGTITKAATCTATGIKTYRCTLCSATKTSTISALGHTFGSGSGWCSRCGYWKVKSTSSLNNEKYVVVTNDATVRNGPYGACAPVKKLSKKTVIYVTQKVKNGQDNIWYKYSDGYIFEDHVKKHTSCTWSSGKVTKAATCTSTGTKEYTCTLCGAKKTSKIKALGHTFGSGSGWCSRCGYWKVKSTSSLNNEKYVVVTNDATVRNGPYGACAPVKKLSKKTVIYVTQKVKNGQDNIWYKYSDGYIFEDHVKKHTSCTWSSGKVTKAATCTSTGTKEYTCTLCGAKKTSKIAKDSSKHKWNKYVCVYCKAWDSKSLKSKTSLNNVKYRVEVGSAPTYAGPYNTSKSKGNIGVGKIVTAVQKVKNAYGNVWYKLSDNRYIFDGNVKKYVSSNYEGLKLNTKSVETYVGSTVIIKASTEKGYFPVGVSISVSDPKMLTVTQKTFTQKKDLLVSNYEFTVKVNSIGKNSGHGKVYVSYNFNGKEYTKICTFTVRSNNIVLAEGATYTPTFKKNGKDVNGVTYSSRYNNKKNVLCSGEKIKAAHTGKVTINYENSFTSGSLKVTVVPKFESSLIDISKNTEYQHDLARFCADFCYLGYDVSNGSMQKRLKKAGFDVSNISVNMNAERDEVNYFIVKKSLGKKTLVFIAAIGSNKDQWYSNFDPAGYSNERKSKYAKDESVHVGFNDAKEYVYSKLKKYLNDNGLTNKNNTVFLITGHSRGAATANLLAAKLIDDSSYPNSNIFAYTFATPNVAKEREFTNKVYSCIFNILNPEDFVTYVMLEKWGYSRYGKSYVLPSSTNCNNYSTYKKRVNESYKKYYHPQGSDYDPYPKGEKATKTIIEKMGQSFPTAASLYEDKYNYTYAVISTTGSTYASSTEGSTVLSDRLSGYEMFKKTILPVVAKDKENTNYMYLLGGAAFDRGIYGDIIRYFIKPDADVQDFTDMDISKMIDIAGGRFAKAHGMETYCSFMQAMSAEEIKVESRKK